MAIRLLPGPLPPSTPTAVDPALRKPGQSLDIVSQGWRSPGGAITGASGAGGAGVAVALGGSHTFCLRSLMDTLRFTAPGIHPEPQPLHPKQQRQLRRHGSVRASAAGSGLLQPQQQQQLQVGKRAATEHRARNADGGSNSSRGSGGSSSRSTELLSQGRRRKSLERLVQEKDKDLDGAIEREAPSREAPFWRRRKGSQQSEARLLTRRIVELGKRKQLGQVLALLRDAQAQGRRLNIITMNAALAACVNCDDIERALDLFDDMTARGGCGVDSITYGTLLKGLGKARRLDDAFELLESMEAGTAPGRPQLTEVHLNTLVNACADAGDARRARSVLQRFRVFGRGVGPSVFTYNLLIKGYARSDNPLEALTVVEEMQLLGLRLQRVSYNSLILACVRGGDLERALELLEEMKAEAWQQRDPDLLPDVVTYTTLLKGLADDGDLDGVIQLAEDMKASSGNCLNPTAAASAAAAGADAAPADVASVGPTACVMDRVAYTAVIDACLAVGSTADALRYLREMEERATSDPSLRPRGHVFLSLMRSLAAQGDLAATKALSERLSHDAAGRVWPEDLWEAQELVLEAAVSSAQWEEAEQQLKAMTAAAAAAAPQSIAIPQKQGAPRFTERGTHAVVQLMAASGFRSNVFEPVAFRPEVPPRAPVETLMMSRSQLQALQKDDSAERALSLLQAQPWVPVLGRSGECVGLVFSEDASSHAASKAEGKSATVRDIMSRPPPCVSRFAPTSEAALMLLSEDARVVAVVAGSARLQMGLLKASTPLEETAVVGFVTPDMLFSARQGQQQKQD